MMSSIANSYSDHVKQLQSRYQKILVDQAFDGLLIDAGCQQEIFLDDNYYPYKTNPHFKAWLPLTDHANSLLLIQQNARPILFYYQADDYWHKPSEEPDGYWVDSFDIHIIRERRDIIRHLPKANNFAYIGQHEDEIIALRLLAKTADSLNPAPIIKALHYYRAYKTEYEKACIEQANKIAVKGHLAAEMAFREGASEFEIQQAYLIATRHREQELPYGNIVGLNENAAILHYQYQQHDHFSADNRHTLLIDAGASYCGYAADITRTYAYRDGVFKDLINGLNTAQLEIIDSIKIGESYVKLHRLTHQKIAKILADFSLIKLDPDAIYETAMTKTFLPHGLGHLLGLQVHDPAGHQQNAAGAIQSPPELYPSLRLTRPVEADQVFTIEPGLYFIPKLLAELKNHQCAASVNWSKIEQLVPYGGIRIEDNICVEKSYTVNFTREAFDQAAVLG